MLGTDGSPAVPLWDVTPWREGGDGRIRVRGRVPFAGRMALLAGRLQGDIVTRGQRAAFWNGATPNGRSRQRLGLSRPVPVRRIGPSLSGRLAPTRTARRVCRAAVRTTSDKPAARVACRVGDQSVLGPGLRKSLAASCMAFMRRQSVVRLTPRISAIWVT